MSNHILYWIFLFLFFNTDDTFGQLQDNQEEKLIGSEYRMDIQRQGTPFFIDEWVDATVNFKSGKSKNNLQIKYDGYKDELIYFNKTRRALIEIEKSTINSFKFSLNGISYVFDRRYLDHFDKKGHFFQVLYQGSVDFLCWRKVELEKDQAGASGQLNYKRTPQFYLQIKKGSFHKIRLSRRSLLRSIKKEQRKMVRKLIRVNRLKFKFAGQFANSLAIIDNELLLLWK